MKDNWAIVDSDVDKNGRPVDVWRQGRTGNFLILPDGVDISFRDTVKCALGSTRESALRNYNRAMR